jgi:phosphoglucosamine mutase
VGNLFGTDGIRGMANRYPLDCETALKTGRAIAAFYQKIDPDGKNRLIIGQDTRISGDMLVTALTAGICSMGKSVDLAGVIPTPGLAYITSRGRYDAGIMISASHNPFYDNGIKLFHGDGYKLSDEQEKKIESYILNPASFNIEDKEIQRIGTIQHLENSTETYCSFLKQTIQPAYNLTGMKIVIDCSNGAASPIAPELFEDLDASVHALFHTPNGTNINDQCGSQHPETLSKTVVETGADLGLAFDGDADRLIAVDEKGEILTGDQILAVCAAHMKKEGKLPNPVIVTTVMSNIGFGDAMEQMGIQHIKAQVGDRYVMQEMVKSNAVIGGEDSGHMIFLDQHTTGDGLFAAMRLLEAIRFSGKKLSELSKVMTVYPQCLINVDVQSKPEIATLDQVVKIIHSVENKLGKDGRVLVRYSGTQPQCRVMVEGRTKSETEGFCRQIADAVKKCIG